LDRGDSFDLTNGNGRAVSGRRTAEAGRGGPHGAARVAGRALDQWGIAQTAS